ncbi:thymidylate synthase, partial [Bacillus subtilis]|nr:thymidylate synthase [Bacillus subtilis]
MTQFDKQYNSIIKDIINNGISDEEFDVRTKWDSDGT